MSAKFQDFHADVHGCCCCCSSSSRSSSSSFCSTTTTAIAAVRYNNHNNNNNSNRDIDAGLDSYHHYAASINPPSSSSALHFQGLSDDGHNKNNSANFCPLIPPVGQPQNHHFRSLPIPDINLFPTAAMNIDFSPDSPPYLSSSSTRSDSTPPSSLHHSDSFTNDTSNFEDISLQDSTRPCREQLETPDFKIRPRLRNSQTLNTSPTSPSRSFSSLKDVPNGLRTATLNHHAMNRDPLSPRLGRQRTWGGSSPSLAPAFPDRTPSPNRNHFPSSPRSNCSSTPRLRSENSPVFTPSPNRTSWQPSRRKTLKELEDEYNDSDEDLPEDAIVWNIPLSPRPRELRSESVSPERASGTSTPKHGGLSRVKSWQAALSDLSTEVQTLTAKLESLAEVEVEEPEKCSPSGRPLGPRRAKTIGVLPPVQKSNVMIDPLPCSKEKEKVLARTRPSWLPPKCPKEEKKHVREYQRMMTKFEDAEKRRSTLLSASQKSNNKENMSTTQIWNDRVLNSWDASIRTPETQDLWWRGIPCAMRGQIWAKAIGNELHLTNKTYEAALKRAKAAERKLATTEASFHERHGHLSETALQRRSLANMHREIATTLPTLNLFQQGRQHHQALVDILMAYGAYRCDTGYVRGTSSIAALLLLQFAFPGATTFANAPATTFIALANHLNRPLALAFCLDDVPTKSRFAARILAALEETMPRLHAHLTSASTGLRVDEWLDPLVQSAFTAPPGLLSLADVERLWDVLVFEDDDTYMVQAVVGVLRRVEGRLYGGGEETKGVLGWTAGANAEGMAPRVESFRVLTPALMMGVKEKEKADVEALMIAVRDATAGASLKKTSVRA